ncbi:gp134 [Sphingomonas phage PAU]|uniref:gp134 n=1 Tax=Sphingomonas phage PAU TaxID=1150991 RepID=UPI0002573279|nr:gp134 [Sphingomonas phage PAU]AFF28132.1 gp134 [Sphingomonas phage PAU]
MSTHIKDSLKPRLNSKFKQGYFEQARTTVNKYIGKRPIIYRSSYEYDAFVWADTSPNVVHWTTEPFPIEYTDMTTGKKHKYWIDLVVKFKDGSTALIEIKPLAQVPRSLNEVKLDPVKRKNFQKWEATKEFCKRNYGYKFIILTEKSLFALTGLSKYSAHR